MLLSFVGMSGCGKSFWSSKLEQELEYKAYCCDELIFNKIFAKQSTNPEKELANWLGEPDSPRYSSREKEYLEAENDVMLELLSNVTSPSIIDSTGSVIYLPSETLELLKKNTTVVLLDADEEHLNKLIQTYLSDPKPIIWESHYSASAENSFPSLLRHRRTQYQRLADVTLEFCTHRSKLKSSNEFIDEVSQHTR